MKRVAVEITQRVIVRNRKQVSVRNRKQVSVVWEYTVEQFAYSDELIQGLLTALGREGWECVGPLPGHPAVGNAGFRMLFKRAQATQALMSAVRGAVQAEPNEFVDEVPESGETPPGCCDRCHAEVENEYHLQQVKLCAYCYNLSEKMKAE